MLTFIKKIIAGQKKIYVIMLIILSILASFEFLLLAIYTSSADNILLRIIPGLAVFVSCFLTILINNYFTESKTEEFSIILLSGRNTKQILKYIIIQFGVLFVLATIIGFILAYLLLLGFTWCIPLFDSQYSFSLSLFETSYTYLAVFGTKMMFVLLFNMATFTKIKISISKYMKHTVQEESKQNYFSDFMPYHKKKKFPVGQCITTILAILLIISSVSNIIKNSNTDFLIIYFASSLLGELLLINKTIPLLFDIFHDRYLIKHPVLLMALTQVMDISKVMASMININACMIPIIFSLFPLASLSTNGLTTLMLCYFILLGIMLLSFIVRFSVYLPTRYQDIATIKALGFSKKDIRKTQQIELLLFFIFIIAIPAIIYSFILYQGYVMKTIALSIVYALLVSYIVLYIVLIIYMLISYRTMTKEVINDVKYLNRSE